jgi:protein O-GlcNAc transferase
MTDKNTPQTDGKSLLTVDAAYAKALALYYAKRFTEAEQLCSIIIQAVPNHIITINLQGLIAQKLNVHDLAIEKFRRAISIDSDRALLYFNLGTSFYKLGLFKESIQALRIAVEKDPDNSQFSDFLYSLNTKAIAKNRDDNLQNQAKEAFEKGVGFHQSGQLSEAIQWYQKTLELNPKNISALTNMGAVLQSKGKLGEAVSCYQKAITIKPNYAKAHSNLGVALQGQGKLDEAVVCLQKAISIKPDYVEANYNLGVVFQEQGKLAEAVTVFQTTISIKPDYAEAYSNLGVVFQGQGKLAEAITVYQTAISIKPDYAKAYSNLGLGFQEQGMLVKAVANFQTAITIKPDYEDAHSNLLLCSQYITGQTLENLFLIHKKWADNLISYSEAEVFSFNIDSSPMRKLRIGLVSSDLGLHPVGYFTSGFFRYHTDQELEIVCYSDRKPDELTKLLESYSDEWVLTEFMNNDQLARRIHSDRIDILIDLSGHTAKNRLVVFLKKPAPIQISWAGYVGTTGLSTMDWLIADQHYVKDGEEQFYSERIIKLPDSWVSYTPPPYTPEINTKLNITATTRIVLGNFGNPAKINDTMLLAWSKILLLCPHADLVLIYKGMDDSYNIDRINSFFDKAGVDLERITISGRISHPKLLAEYNSLDLALDTLPYSGGLTSIEALWMGVPVVTADGDTFAGRHSASILRTVGLDELVADNLDEYIKLVVNLVLNPEKINKLKNDLRSQVANSPLCDYNKFAINLSSELREVWIEWCNALHCI